MKKLPHDAGKTRKGSTYPPPFDQVCRDRVRRAIGNVAGLTDFGVNILQLPPGMWSSQRHWHTHEDEFTWVLEGQVVLVTNDGEEILNAGDCAGFKAGVADGHHFQNRSDCQAVLLEVGSRREGQDAVDYPDIDLRCDADGIDRHKDGAPYARAAIDIFEAHSPGDYAAAHTLFVEYAESLQVDLCFQGFAEELERLPQMYGAPGGCLLLARRGDEVAGCIGVRSNAPRVCEMKRLYVRQSLRGHGTGRALALRAIDAARALGYRQMLLDTLSTMRAARTLYQRLGFRQIDAYYRNPMPGTSYMALDL